MTAVPSDVAPGPILPAWIRRYTLAPAEGWLTLFFVILMSLTVAWSLDDAAWVLNNRAWGDFFSWGTLAAALIAFAGAKAGWPRWGVHLVGAVSAALILPVMAGSTIVGDGGSPGEFFRATAASAVQAWIDLAINNRAVTQETAHYLLFIGVVCWSVGQFAAYAVFGHRRPLDAVIVVGIILLANMAMTPNDQLGFLVVYSISALGVLARTHAFEEETTWVRRRIGDATAVRSIYLRGGAVFIGAAVFGSLVLTASASSAPLAGLWHGFDRQLIAWSRDLQRLFPFGGNTRVSGFGFGDSATISGQWVASDTLALTIQVPPGDTQPYYWRAAVYDRYDLSAWAWTAPTGISRRAGQQVFQGLADGPTNAFARRDLTYRVRVEAAVGDFVFSPQDPVIVDQDTRIETVGGAGYFSALRTEAEAYAVTAAVPVLGASDNGLTANRLRAAGTSYPDEIKRLYLKKTEGAIGPNARALLEDILADAGPDWTPYDLAALMEDRLRNSPEFHYDNDVRGICSNQSAVECFATYKRGYCLHYASTMAILLREAGVPTRMALGYLPGTRDPRSGIETIRASGAHAWVEVWFPGIGWYRFDPTGGLNSPGRDTIPEGPLVTAAPSVNPTFGSVRDARETDPVNQGGGTPTTPGRTNAGDNPAVLIAIAVLLLAAVGGLAFVAWQRGPRGEVTPDAVWRGIARMAGRFGFGPRPQQTVYEYAGSLGDVLPLSRPELQTVARAKVEVAYGRRVLGDDSMRRLRDAQRRLRLGLLRLALRRRERGRFRRS